MRYAHTSATQYDFSKFPFILFISLLLFAGIGIAMQYSVGGMSWQPWAKSHLIKIALGFCIMGMVMLMPLRFWWETSWIIYLISLLGLIIVLFAGKIGMGAQRWIDIGGFFNFQPSEAMKVAIILFFAARFAKMPVNIANEFMMVIKSALLFLLPCFLIIRQPDLGTTLLVAMSGITMIFLSGINYKYIRIAFLLALVVAPAIWYTLEPYQKRRVEVFLNPAADLLDSGYHIQQSKISIGSGGMLGKGYGQGTQSQYGFLPEKHTDFIFAVLAEEFGFIGSMGFFTVIMLIILFGYQVSFRSSSQFGRLLVLGLITNFSFYVFINIAMVVGIIPVVGVPLPMISYGGTAIIMFMFSMGLVFAVAIQRDSSLNIH
jgi:rod shape determining protein RodA